MSGDDVAGLYDDLEADTDQLSSAVDADITFNVEGSADLSCTAAGCVVTAEVTSDTAAGEGATIEGGQVAAQLTATVEIQGEGAGGCTATATLPLNGTSSIACTDPGAGGVWEAAVQAAQEEAQEEADAEAEASGGEASVHWQVEGIGEAYVTATAQVDVQQQIQDEDDEKNAAGCLDGGRPAPAPAAFHAAPAADPSPEGGCEAIPDATRLDQPEQDTAARLLNDPSYTGGRLRESEDPDYDYVDQYNRTYDAIGQPKAYQPGNWNGQQFLGQLDRHINKQGLNFTVLDLTGADSGQLDDIFSHIDALPQAWQKRLLIVGD